MLKIFSILITIQGIFAQNCQLNATHMDRRWIYTTKSTTTNKFDILHTDYIKNQTFLYLICNGVSNVREIFCNSGQLQEKEIFPNPTCPGRLRANIVMLTNENSCRRMGGDLYQVRYNLPDGSIIPLYNVCYNKLYEQPMYSRHKSYGFNLAASTYKRPRFTVGDIVSRKRELSFEAANVYNTFVRLLGINQTYVPDNKTVILERGHLANSQDFLTYDQMDETFKYLNVVPQFRGGNRSNWKRIENWIHNLPSNNTYSEVVTGSFGILTLPHSEISVHVSMYLMENNKNPIPLWLYKVVKYNGVCYAFVTLNNEFNTNANINTTHCRSIACPNGLEFSRDLNKGISYCCNYNNFVRNIGRHAFLC